MFWQEIAAKGVQRVCDAINDREAFDMAERYGAHNYHPLPVNVVRAEGGFVWDGSGKRYLDCIGAYSALAHGHLNPKIVKSLVDQAAKLTLTGRANNTTEMALFDKALCLYTGMDKVCPMNSGAEAVETCVKIARKWAYTVKGVPKDRAEIIACAGNFHGRTTTLVGFSDNAQYHDLFGPYSTGFKLIPFGDAQALTEAITPNSAAFLAEPIQAEGGVIVPPPGYMAEVRRICDDQRVLLIWDEVQTGFCRTGKPFAWMHEDAKPDLMAVGKALGGGLLPVSAAVGCNEAMEVLEPGDHGSTFGGNPLACAVAVASIAEMVVQEYDRKAQALGNRLVEGFAKAAMKKVKEIRGLGMLVGLELADGVDALAVQHAFVNEGVLTKETRHRTFRFTPPLTVDFGFIDEIISRVKRVLS